jgi:hypothetical protein
VRHLPHSLRNPCHRPTYLHARRQLDLLWDHRAVYFFRSGGNSGRHVVDPIFEFEILYELRRDGDLVREYPDLPGYHRNSSGQSPNFSDHVGHCWT